VEIGTLPLVMEEAVAGINLHLFIDPDFHCSSLTLRSYNLIIAKDP